MADGAVELALLRSRFPGQGLEESGRILSDFFCARRSGGCVYEGRLFVMDRALLFVSTHSSQYDLLVSHTEVEQITLVRHGFLPSLTLSLSKNKELFTNFHNLTGLVELIGTLELPTPVSADQPPAPSIQRMASVPSNSSTPDPCPFFMRSGFCPRRPLCKLDHTPQPHPSSGPSAAQSAANMTGGPSKLSLGLSGTQSNFLQTSPNALSKPKRFHHMDNSEDNPSINTSTSFIATTTATTIDTVSTTTSGVSMATKSGSGRRRYRRSISLPAAQPRWQGGRAGERVTCAVDERESTQLKTGSMTSSSQEGVSPVGLDSTPVVPKEFDFSQRGCEDVESEGVRSDGVFVFTASPTKAGESGEPGDSGEEVKSKPWSGGREDEEEERDENEVVAELAQQLQLDSDSDSIQGDLDVEAQQKILDSLSPAGRDDDQPGPSNRAMGQNSIKRRPCVYFLSGFCRNGVACPQYHGLDFDPDFDPIDIPEMDQSDEEAGGQEPVALPTEVKVYHADHTHLGSGDKIILSQEVLMACEQQHLAYPVAFKLTHSASGQSLYCGVLQFTAPSSDSAYLPSWMMDHLEANNGDAVNFSHVQLPKGNFVRLQPVSSAWLGIPYEKRMAMMEFQLRNFQTLTEGTKVTLTYELNRYTLKVLQCKPAKGISILNADITTDVTEPADLSRYHSVVEGEAEHIVLGQAVDCSILSSSYRHFVLLALPGRPLPERLFVEVKMKSGDPDLFLCQNCTAPSQCRYTWCSQKVGDSIIQLTTDDKDFNNEKPLYAGVVSLCEDSEFSIAFRDQSELPTCRGAAISPGQTLRSPSHFPKATPTDPKHGFMLSPDETDSTPVPTDHEQCPTCGSVMPALRLVMHQRHCANSTFICPHCKAVLPKNAERKHKYIAHELLMCACGMELTQLALHHHQNTDCSKRMVQCQFKWCSLSFPMDQLVTHESICGRRKVNCCICQEEVSQLEMAIHLEAFHSVDTRDLDWSKPLQREEVESRVSKPQFSCGCGLGFEFQDDMEVHQLTDCPMRRIADSLSSTEGEIVG